MNELSIDTAPLPVTYESAKTALAECDRVDECKDWADRAAALASYARQSKDKALLLSAIRIQRRALERAGELLKEYDGKGNNQHTEGDHGKPTQRQAADAAGFSEYQQLTAVRIASIPKSLRNELIESDDPPTLDELAALGTKQKQPSPDYLAGRSPELFNRILHLVGSMEQAARWASDYLADCAETIPAMTPQDLRRLDMAFDTISRLQRERMGRASHVAR